MFESVTTLLKNVARIEPLVIVIDDLHDADSQGLFRTARSIKLSFDRKRQLILSVA